MNRGIATGMLFLSLLAAFSGCQSPYHSDQGALFGGLLGAGTGAVVGSAVGHPLAGAAIGAGVGTVGGAAIGNGMDQVEAKNRAMIEQQMGRQISANPVTVQDVVAMTRAGVNEELIANHVRSHGLAAPLQASDLIYLQQNGVSNRVIATMQAPPPPPQPVVIQEVPPPPPVIIEGYAYPYGPPCRRRPYYYY